jgi:hypothetical protein
MTCSICFSSATIYYQWKAEVLQKPDFTHFTLLQNASAVTFNLNFDEKSMTIQ